MPGPIYNPAIFEQVDIDSAREIILTPENGVSTQVRWDSETPWLLSLIANHMKPGGLVVDYGCGVGRIAGPLLNHGYPVIGLDSSGAMRRHAAELIANERFIALSPAMFDQLISVGVRVEGIVAIWVLQHCFDLEAEVERIYRSLNQGGIVGIADMRHRAVPTNQGWVNDGKNVNETLCRYFTLIQQYPYNLPNGPKNLSDNAYIAFFRKAAKS